MAPKGYIRLSSALQDASKGALTMMMELTDDDDDDATDDANDIHVGEKTKRKKKEDFSGWKMAEKQPVHES